MRPAASFVIDGRYINDHFPGIGRYTFNLIGALARVAQDEKFILLYNPAQKNTRYDLAALARNSNLEFKRVDAAPRSWREQFAIPRAVGDHEGRPYIFHSPYYLKPYFVRARNVVTIFDLIPILFPQTVSLAARLFFPFAILLAVQTSARIIVPSISTQNDLVTILRVPREKLALSEAEGIAVIPLAADARFAPQSRKEIARAREKYSLPARYVLYVGSNKLHKNLATLIAAWRVADRADAALVIAGGLSQIANSESRIAKDKFPFAIRNQPSAFNIHFLRDFPDADLPALYSGAEIFVMPSLSEGFGLPLLEAMQCGAPCIASNASSLPEVGGDAILYFNPRDGNALAQLLARGLNDAALRAELRSKSVARAKNFSWERAARETLQVYKSQVAGRKAQSARRM